ncbi:MAG: GatB/YqeY domain-containing protein [Rhodospirillales bacterium]|nr:GatB/YqeY domain-containing protein [Rhodospirillales bacterium]
MGLRDSLTEALKVAMKARQPARTSTLRLILAKLKETDIAARPKGPVPDSEILAMLRGMVKSRGESVALYRQGNRPDLVAKETAEIAVIEEFLPPAMDEAELAAAVAKAIAETGAAGPKDMGKVMAALKSRHTGRIDLGRAGAIVKVRLGG